VADIDAVIFDWGGTLTPWRSVDYSEEWRSLARVVAPDDVERVAGALLAASDEVWARGRDHHRSGTLEEILTMVGLDYDEAHFADYRAFWEHATFTDPDVPGLFGALADARIRVGVLSNTVWPRAWHEDFFARDEVLHLIDGAVYTSEIAWTKPAPEAFEAAMEAVGATDPRRCVFVGDRLFDDIWGAARTGMRTVHVPHSTIPENQHGHSFGTPDAVVDRLADVWTVVEGWLGD
jgi:putative hydrolase of the HAD superfamily